MGETTQYVSYSFNNAKILENWMGTVVLVWKTTQPIKLSLIKKGRHVATLSCVFCF